MYCVAQKAPIVYALYIGITDKFSHPSSHICAVLSSSTNPRRSTATPVVCLLDRYSASVQIWATSFYQRFLYFPLLIGRKIRRPHLVRDKAVARRPCDLCGRRHVPLLRTGMCGGKRSHAGRPAAKTLGASASASCAADAAERACRHKKGAVTASCFYTISLQPLFHLELPRVRSAYLLQEEPHAVGDVAVNPLAGRLVCPAGSPCVDVRMRTCAKALDLEPAIGEEPAL